ncbi:MAG: VOC family protein [Actinomycetota bacterium]
MPKITPHLWFDNQAKQAAAFYVATFPDSKVMGVTTIYNTPSGDCDIVSFNLFGQPFMAISAGPEFQFTPAVSFLVACTSKEEANAFWNALAEGGSPFMPLGAYPFSEHYGWTTDRYGLSWQVMYSSDLQVGQRITPTLMFTGEVCGKAEEAVNFYASLFAGSAVDHVFRYGPGEEPELEGTVKHTGFTLEGNNFAAMDSSLSHEFSFNEAISLIVECKNQQEIDRFWEALSAVPEAEQCGWLNRSYPLLAPF